MIKSLGKIIIAVFLIGSFSSCAAQTVIFEEDFNGTQLDMNSWSYEEGDGCPDLCGWGNNEKQIYDRDYVEVKDGNLVITAQKVGEHYYSGKIVSKDKVEFQYGTIEVRAKFSGGKGIWPAFWMLGADISEVGWPASGEIDIMEYVGREPGRIFNSLHTPASHGDTENTRKTRIENLEDEYHVYKAEWSSEQIDFYVDDKLLYSFVPEQYDDAHYPFRKKFYFLINMAVGGNFGGPEIDDSIFPIKYYIDHIKVTKK